MNETNKFKSARKKAGYTQMELAAITGIPFRTIQDWEGGKRTPADWCEKLVLAEIQRISEPLVNEKFYSAAVQKYTDACIKFARDTSEWLQLDEYMYYTTNGTGWCESCDNANDGIHLDWAFHQSENNIRLHSAEMLFEHFAEELQLAIDDGWDSQSLQTLYNKYCK